MTDNRTTELLDGLRNVGNLHEFAELFGFDWHDESDWTWHDVAVKMADELEQAIAATLGTEYHGYEQAAIEAWKSIKTWNTRAERKCECGWRGFVDGWGYEPPNYCPKCGGKKVSE